MTEKDFWPPKVVFGNERGWLNVRDSETGQWFSIPARGAPRGWVDLAIREAALKRAARKQLS
jgi:hypothetical protein